MIPKDIFYNVVKFTPLISIDLILENSEKKLLLGWRTNSPAKNTWFVPGGRILKDETLDNAFVRISENELGIKFTMNEAEFLGVYEHNYPHENFFEENSFSTHYIVLGFRIKVNTLINLPLGQHKDYKWSTSDEILNDTDVHENVKNYFRKTKGIR